MAIPGLKVVVPSTPVDMVGLFAAAVRDPDPVIVVEPKVLYATKGEVPDGEIVDQLGARERRPRPATTSRSARSGRWCPRRSRRRTACGRRGLGRGDRRAVAGAARHADDPGVRRADEPARHRGGEPAAVRVGRRGRVDRRGGGVLRPGRADRAGDDAAPPAPVGRRARGPGDPVGRTDRATGVAPSGATDGRRPNGSGRRRQHGGSDLAARRPRASRWIPSWATSPGATS